MLPFAAVSLDYPTKHLHLFGLKLGCHRYQAHRQISNGKIQNEDVHPGRPLPVPRPRKHQDDDGIANQSGRHDDSQGHDSLNEFRVPHRSFWVHSHVMVDVHEVGALIRGGQRGIEVVDGVLGRRWYHDQDCYRHPNSAGAQNLVFVFHVGGTVVKCHIFVRVL
ncbi:hypothetical protein TNCV_2328461 [Trichonephila clavipes]|nr:hypothetical protein TNCV_2328461 [Trichonephila clavipes]